MSVPSNEATAREAIVDAGRRLVAAGLVARSWGNISLRLDKERCLITPSGRLYSDLKADEIVIYQIHTAKYEGSLKPSSEAGLHARIYQVRPEVHAIIHTHQPQASVLAAAHVDLPLAGDMQRELLGSWVRCAPYALPSTKKLVTATSRALGGGRAVLMANHGALCVGENLDDAFGVADALEAAGRYIKERFRQLVARQLGDDQAAMHAYFLERLRREKGFGGAGLR